MLLTPTPTGDSFFDPPSSDQSAAILILDGERLQCRLVEISIGGFGVSVPRATTWTGEPIARLLTQAAAYPVRIIKQEAQYNGFYFTLQRIQELKTDPDESLGLTQRWIIHASRCCAIGLIAAMTYCFLAAPGGNSNDARTVRPQTMTQLWSWNWQSWPRWMGGRGQSVSKSESELTALTMANDAYTDRLFEMPAISVSSSSIAPAANGFANSEATQLMTSSRSGGASEVDPQAQAIASATRQAQIKFSLLTARRGPTWTANSITLPWLFSATESPVRSGPAFHMSEAARNDLHLFQSGLKSLPTTSANDATRSLRRALLATASAPGLDSNFENHPDVRLIRSDDAEIYFVRNNGAVEILRVVPRDTYDPATARSSSPTSSLSPHAVSR